MVVNDGSISNRPTKRKEEHHRDVDATCFLPFHVWLCSFSLQHVPCAAFLLIFPSNLCFYNIDQRYIHSFIILLVKVFSFSFCIKLCKDKIIVLRTNNLMKIMLTVSDFGYFFTYSNYSLLLFFLLLCL